MTMDNLTGAPYILARLKRLRAKGTKVKLVRYCQTPSPGMQNIFGDRDPDRAEYRYLNNKTMSPPFQGPARIVDELIARRKLTKNGQLRGKRR
jgi:hypothetical protein